MSYQRIIKTYCSPELYKLAILADFEALNYSVVIMRSNRSKSFLKHHVLGTFKNLQEATRDFNRRLADKPELDNYFKQFFGNTAPRSVMV